MKKVYKNRLLQLTIITQIHVDHWSISSISTLFQQKHDMFSVQKKQHLPFLSPNGLWLLVAKWSSKLGGTQRPWCWLSIESWLLHRDPYVMNYKFIVMLNIYIYKYLGGIIPYIQQITHGFWYVLINAQCSEVSSHSFLALSSGRHDLGGGKLWTTQTTHALLF